MDNDEDDLLDNEDDMEDFEEFDDLISSEEFETEIDKQNPIQYLNNVFTKLRSEKSNFYVELINTLGNEKQSILEKVILSINNN